MIPSGTRHRLPLVVVLGATGLIGSAVTAALAREPVRLRAVARRQPAWARSYPEMETVVTDLTRPGRTAEAVAGADAVINLVKHDGDWRAADDDPGSRQANVAVTSELLEALRTERGSGPPPIVLFSGTTTQVGVPPDRPLAGNEPDRPVTTYDRHKLTAETLLKRATREGTVRGVSLRLPTVFGYGPTESTLKGVVAGMARRALGGQPLTMWNDGTVLRELVYMADVAQVFVAALTHAERLAGRHWLIGSDRSVPLRQLFSMIAEEAASLVGGSPAQLLRVDPPADAPVIDLMSVTIDSSPFRTVTKWRPTVPLREAVAQTVAAVHRFTTSVPLEETHVRSAIRSHL